MAKDVTDHTGVSGRRHGRETFKCIYRCVSVDLTVVVNYYIVTMVAESNVVAIRLERGYEGDVVTTLTPPGTQYDATRGKAGKR